MHQNHLLDCLRDGRSVESVAEEFAYDLQLLHYLLEFLHQRTDILARFGSAGYRLNPKYAAYSSLGFHIDKFIGGYGPAVSRLDEALRAPELGRSLVDERALMRAYVRLDRSASAAIAEIIKWWGVPSLLDLGCGVGALLRELCLVDASFKGWGIESDESRCAAAHELVKAEGLDGRLRIVQGDVGALETCLEADTWGKIAAVHGGSILNEFFREGPEHASRVVKMLSKLLPNRLFFVTDYYGKLGSLNAVGSRYRHTLIQDVAQAISAQGVPPADLDGWATMYEAAGCRVVHVYQGAEHGLDWFVHVVKL
jgi:hypothetical protein